MTTSPLVNIPADISDTDETVLKDILIKHGILTDNDPDTVIFTEPADANAVNIVYANADESVRKISNYLKAFTEKDNLRRTPSTYKFDRFRNTTGLETNTFDVEFKTNDQIESEGNPYVKIKTNTLDVIKCTSLYYYIIVRAMLLMRKIVDAGKSHSSLIQKCDNIISAVNRQYQLKLMQTDRARDFIKRHNQGNYDVWFTEKTVDACKESIDNINELTSQLNLDPTKLRVRQSEIRKNRLLYVPPNITKGGRVKHTRRCKRNKNKNRKTARSQSLRRRKTKAYIKHGKK